MGYGVWGIYTNLLQTDLGNEKKLWVTREYGLCGVCVRRESTVVMGDFSHKSAMVGCTSGLSDRAAPVSRRQQCQTNSKRQLMLAKSKTPSPWAFLIRRVQYSLDGGSVVSQSISNIRVYGRVTPTYGSAHIGVIIGPLGEGANELGKALVRLRERLQQESEN